jgi:hypothetical protein
MDFSMEWRRRFSGFGDNDNGRRRRAAALSTDYL